MMNKPVRQKCISAKAPGVVKLFGEHAVVYGKTCIAAAINRYAKVKIKRVQKSTVILKFNDLPSYKKIYSLDRDSIFLTYKDFNSGISVQEFLKKHQKDDELVLPASVIIGEFSTRFNVDVRGLKFIFSSDIPIERGVASSAALSVALTTALANFSGLKIDDKTLIEIARNGEKVIHQNENAGRIDISTSFYGGIVKFNAKTGIKKYSLEHRLPLFLIDTGPKKKTADMVRIVANKHEYEKEKVDRIFTKMDKCAIKGLSFLLKGNLVETGKLMYENEKLLELLGVSNKRIDYAVRLCIENRVEGAKLSGGGGGGIMIGLGMYKKSFSAELEKKHFGLSKIEIAEGGAKSCLLNLKR
jgi:mevalonate kinase